MNRPIQPSSRLGWWALWLGFATGLWARVFPLLPALLGPRLPIRIPLGRAGSVIEVALALAALSTGVIAMRRGERSWLNIIAFVLAAIIGGAWLLFALGQVVVPD